MEGNCCNVSNFPVEVDQYFLAGFVCTDFHQGDYLLTTHLTSAVYPLPEATGVSARHPEEQGSWGKRSNMSKVRVE